MVNFIIGGFKTMTQAARLVADKRTYTEIQQDVSG